MTREIKFRGMSISGEWCYGYLSVVSTGRIDIERGSYISNKMGSPFAYQVRPETVGQFTGIKDCKGKDIYEGDQLFAYGNLDKNYEEYVGDVEWDADDARFEVASFHGRFEYMPGGCFVKGNIHESIAVLEATV